MSQQAYRLGTDFPREGFVQAALEAYFSGLGFRAFTHGHVDYAGLHPDTRETWLVEAKGETADVGLDLRTGLGQILQHMAEPSVRYGLAVPRTPKFIAQCKKLPGRVRVALGLHWLFVDPDGTVTVVRPDESVPGLGV